MYQVQLIIKINLKRVIFYWPHNNIILIAAILISPEVLLQLLKSYSLVHFTSTLKIPATRGEEEIEKDLSISGISKVKLISRVTNRLSSIAPSHFTCLIKALALHKMLNRRNIPNTIHFGIDTNLSNGLKAHAWLSVNSVVVTGGSNLENFVELKK